MKLAFSTFLLYSTCIFSQTAKFDELDMRSNYSEYITKHNDTLKIGDELILGIPSNEAGFVYISQANQIVSRTLSGKKVIVTKLKTFGKRQNGYKMYALFKGYGLLPVLIDYDTAIEVGEVINPNAKPTKSIALKKIKEAKEKLDLELITQNEYDAIKNELAPFVK